MPQSVNNASVDLIDNRKLTVGTLELYSERPNTLRVLDLVEAKAFGEEPVQLFEECVYEYRIHSSIPGARLRESEAATSGHINGNAGRIEPGSYTGVLTLVLEDASGSIVGRAAVEVCSSKLSYREDYREMLEYIGEKCTDLLLSLRAPLQVRLLPDPGKDPGTIHQRFAFLKSVLESPEFSDSLQRIAVLPHQRLEEEHCEIDIRSRFKPSGRIVKQIAKDGQRIPLPERHPLAARLKAADREGLTLPARIQSFRSRETTDTPENRFVKHALTVFADFLLKMRAPLISLKTAQAERLIREIESLHEALAEILARDFFRDISEPTVLPLGSPVLQRKAGYREVLQAWLKFNLAARLVWAGGDDVYGAGKRDMGALYEYWLFFQMLDLVAAHFELDKPPLDTLIETGDNGFGLRLKSGRQLVLDGLYTKGSRRLRVRFSYNRTFNWTEQHTAQGVWTRRMRPDFTLSLWPDFFTPEEAEEQELMVHLHFDAKYRAESIDELFGGDGDDLEIERAEQRRGTYKRSDLLKMHAYRDAIRRSEGAYIIYPGTENRVWREFREILPSIGAFAVRPGENGKALGLDSVSDFISTVLEHLCDRATGRERLSYHRFDVLRSAPDVKVFTPTPESKPTVRERAIPPAEHFVLIAPYVDAAALVWILKNGRYMLPLPEGTMPPSLDPKLAQINHVLLQGKGDEACPGLWRVVNTRPRLYTKNELQESGYPAPVADNAIYIEYELESDPAYEGYEWTVAKLMPGDLENIPPTAFVSTLDLVLNAAGR